MSVKFQITFLDELASQLREAAAGLHISPAQFIRETMEDRLRQMKANELPGDPFASIRGIVDSAETDLSSRIDEILCGEEPHR